MTKKEFINKVRSMSSPKLREVVDSYYDLLNVSFVIQDDENFSNKAHISGVRLSYKEWRINSKLAVDDYYVREDKYRAKINRWFNEAIK